MSKFLVRYSVILCCVFFVGCMWQEPRQLHSSLKTRIRYLQNMQCWRITGRVNLNQASNNINASFTWQQNDDKYHVYFFSPFTSESLTIQGDDHGFKVIGDQNHANGLDLEQQLPFKHLRFWLKGMASPHSVVQNVGYDTHNQLISIQQDGWLIEFQNYDHTRPISLPKKLSITDGQLQAKLLIKNWQN